MIRCHCLSRAAAARSTLRYLLRAHGCSDFIGGGGALACPMLSVKGN